MVLFETRHNINKYRGGTSDETTSSSLIISLIFISFNDFLPYSLFESNTGPKDGPTDTTSYIDA